MAFLRSFGPARCGATVSFVIAWMCACGVGKETPAGVPLVVIPSVEPTAAPVVPKAARSEGDPRWKAPPPALAPQSPQKEILPGRTVGDTTCQTDADCVVGTPSEGCCPCCPEAPRATSRAWLAWFAGFQSPMCASQRCGTVCNGAVCEKVEDASAFRAVCREQSCALVRARGGGSEGGELPSKPKVSW